ncbi:hypothetical protein [Chryseolinea lacunae]|uniref:Uncharacterized protein n=1 Tax=Chryseolinea lacunae TaxID=2801331 RepID=A0ABS1KNZ4_9BACT|nr:hypothetical protein [Chryseolinea lacunae]MBL0739971.1 hypothetical protein [Chryseolinea lacunae]
MKSILKGGAVSARLEAAHQINARSVHSGTLGLAIAIVTLLLSSCNGNDSRQAAELKKHPADSLAKPKVDIKVNRRYDEKGNMIGFDSTYTSYYSNISGDTARMDSLMGSFDRYFRADHSSFFRNQFDPLFFTDSTRYPDFFHDDFFMRRYELNDPYFRNMMRDMDSIKNSFYKEHREANKKPVK